MKKIIYADNAATTKLDIDAFNVMKAFLLNEYANPSSKYSFSRPAKKAIKEARQSIADCLNTKSEEIFFTSGGSEGDNWILKSVAHSTSKRHIITSVIEHHAILETCQKLEREGYQVTYLPVDNSGHISVEDLEKAITSDTTLVSIMMANNEIGTIQKIKELAEVAHENGVLFHTDAVQAVGHIPIDMEVLKVDFLTASAHKFNGYKGTGFVYIKEQNKIEPFIFGGAQEKQMRAGTENVAGIAAMATALKKNVQNMQENDKKTRAVVNALIEELRSCKLDFIRNGSDDLLPGIVSLSFKNSDGELVLHRLDLQGICISTGAACNSVETVASHVISAIGLTDNYANGTIRVSFNQDNTEEEARIIANEICRIINSKNRCF